MVNYVTEGALGADKEQRGKVVGFYLVSHFEGHRNDFTAHWHHTEKPEQWRHALKAIRAFEFLPEYWLHRNDLDPTIINRPLAVARYGEALGTAQIERLSSVPYREVPVFGTAGLTGGDIVIPMRGRHVVRAGPVNRSGYLVPGEPVDTEKELYALVLTGSMPDYLLSPQAGRLLYKIGLSMSPATRLEAFRKAMPEGRFKWQAHRSTRADGHNPYPSFEAAEAGERAMKEALSRSGEGLGGEFYAATPEKFELAWRAGRAAALAYGGSKTS